jgi:hypothetical protein
MGYGIWACSSGSAAVSRSCQGGGGVQVQVQEAIGSYRRPAVRGSRSLRFPRLQLISAQTS